MGNIMDLDIFDKKAYKKLAEHLIEKLNASESNGNSIKNTEKIIAIYDRRTETYSSYEVRLRRVNALYGYTYYMHVAKARVENSNTITVTCDTEKDLSRMICCILLELFGGENE